MQVVEIDHRNLVARGGVREPAGEPTVEGAAAEREHARELGPKPSAVQLEVPPGADRTHAQVSASVRDPAEVVEGVEAALAVRIGGWVARPLPVGVANGLVDAGQPGARR